MEECGDEPGRQGAGAEAGEEEGECLNTSLTGSESLSAMRRQEHKVTALTEHGNGHET